MHRLRLDDHSIYVLESPLGQKVLLTADAGGILRNGSAENYDPALDIMIDDAGATMIPDNAQPTHDTIYKPSDYAGLPDTLPAPGPAGPYSTALSTFIGIDPNGTWKLWAASKDGAKQSSLGG